MAATAHGMLTANQVTSVTVTSGSDGIVVVNRTVDGGVLWVRIDGTDPVPGGPDTYVVLGAREFPLAGRYRFKPITVRLIADTERAYSVEAIG